jgi:hypothetical protein
VGGYIARGFIWACIGGVAIAVAFTEEDAQDQKGSVEYVASHIGGTVVLVLACIGIFCYSAWRFFELFYGLRDHPQDSKFKRAIDAYITPLASGIFYITFGVGIAQTIRSGRSNGSSTSWSASLADHTAGKVLLTIAGIILFGVSIGWLVDLIRGKFKEEMNRPRLERHRVLSHIVYTCGYVGITGRAILFSLLAALLMRTAFDPNEKIKKGGFGVALTQLKVSTGGRVFLVILGVLLIIFGTYSLFTARYKKYFSYRPQLLPTGFKAGVKCRAAHAIGRHDHQHSITVDDTDIVVVSAPQH